MVSESPSTRVLSVLVAYDIADDDRRQDVYELLLTLGVRVQLSLFECRVRGAEGVRSLVDALQARIDSVEDQVRLYQLGSRPFAARILGQRTIEEWQDFIYVP